MVCYFLNDSLYPSGKFTCDWATFGSNADLVPAVAPGCEAKYAATLAMSSAESCAAIAFMSAAERREVPRDLPRRLQGIVQEVPHDQLPRDQAGALLLRQQGRGGGGEGGQAAPGRLGAVRRSVCGQARRRRQAGRGRRQLLRAGKTGRLHGDGA